METVGNKKINSQFLGNKPIIRTYKGVELINEYKPLYNPPSDWKDIRSDCPENSIRLLADERYPLGFTAYATGGYTVKIDGELKGTYASGAQCSIPQTDWPKVHINSLTAYGATEQSGTPTPSVPVDIVSNNGTLKARHASGLPLGYTLLDSVIFDSTQVIDTGFIPDNNSRIESKCYRTGDDCWFYGASPSNPRITLYHSRTGTCRWGYQSRSNVGFVADTEYTIIEDKNGLNINGVDNPWTSGTADNFTCDRSLTIGNNNGSSGTRYFAGNFYYMKIYDNGVLARDFVPCKNASNVVGLYDVVNGVFYTDTGLIAGNPVSDLVEIYTDGTVETITDSLSNTATAEMLLKVGNYQDTQEVIAGNVIRKVGINVFDGTENWTYNAQYSRFQTSIPTMPVAASRTLPFISTHYQVIYSATTDPGYMYNGSNRQLMISDAHTSVEDWTQWLADQYNAGTPVIIVYPLATSTTETVTPQALAGTTATVTAGSISDLQITYTQTQGGYPIDYPTGAQTAHIVDIYPTTEGNNITAFSCKRVASSGSEAQAILWAHFNITNSIDISNLFSSSQIVSKLLEAVTAKNNLITYTVTSNGGGLNRAFEECSALEYLPVFKSSDNLYTGNNYIPFLQVKANVNIENNSGNETFAIINGFQGEKFQTENGLTLASGTAQFTSAQNAINLKKFPKINQNKGETFVMFNCPNLEPVNIDDRFNNIRTLFRFYGTQSNPTPALKSLRVSNEAPFNNATAPQININYTDMDRNALVQLFEDLPYNVGYTIVGSPTISQGVASNFTGNDYPYIDHSINGATPIEYSTKFTTGTLSGNQELLAGIKSGGGYSFRVFIQGTNTLLIAYNPGTEGGGYLSLSYAFQNNTTYSLKISYNGDKTLVATVYNASGEQVATQTFTQTVTLLEISYLIIGTVGTGSSVWSGSINLNNTYIKVNGVYWFRGQASMTKTLSCVGCTGTADLTADDKDIALDKGWSLTLS